MVLLYNDLDSDEIEHARLELTGSPLFISLGSHCEIANVTRDLGLRKAAFPFDWVTTFDAEKFLEILEGNFKYFLDERYLIVREKDLYLMNDYYHCEFLHEGRFTENTFTSQMQSFKERYQRRIDRFRKLAEYKGRVYFLRTAYEYSLTDPYRYYKCRNNLEIADDYALKLFSILRKFFPALDFILIIVNNDNGSRISEEKRIGDRIIKIRSNLNKHRLEISNAYCEYFIELLKTYRQMS